MNYFSIQDKLPSHEVPVLTVDNENQYEVLCYNTTREIWFTNFGMDWEYSDCILYWMPLPQPPSSSNSDYAKSCDDCIYGVDGCQYEPPCTTGTGKPYYKKRDFT